MVIKVNNKIRFTHYKLPTIPYTPGKTERPTLDPLENEEVTPQPISKLPTYNNPFFLYGLDLFNNGFYWEAHETWEELWHLEDSILHKRMIQGFIQLAASMVKRNQGNSDGQEKLLASAIRYIFNDY